MVVQEIYSKCENFEWKNGRRPILLRYVYKSEYGKNNVLAFFFLGVLT